MSSVDEDELRGAFVRISEQQQPPLRVSAEDILREGQRMGRRRRQLSVAASGAAAAAVAVVALLATSGRGTDHGPAMVPPAEGGTASMTPSSARITPAPLPTGPPLTGPPLTVAPSPSASLPASGAWPDVPPTTFHPTSGLLTSAHR